MNSKRTWLCGWLSLLILGSLWTPAQAQSGDWEMLSFASNIKVQSDANILVTETIEARFLSDKHGIFRNIPYRYETDKGEVSVPVEVSEVLRNNQPEPYEQIVSENNIEVKIGDADVTITGTQTYIITYTVRAAVNFFDEHDELYWNVTGDAWEVPLAKASAEVLLDVGASPGALDLQAACFTGQTGSTTSACTVSSEEHSAKFVSQTNEPLTIVFGWPKGLVTKPDNYDEIRANAGKSLGERLAGNPVIFWGLNIILPILVIGWLIRHWLMHGRDPKGQGTVIAQYDPPAELTPGEMGTLFDENANHRDVVATIVDLAVRGYLTITEIEEDKFLGLGKSKDYRLDKKMGANVGALKPHEKELHDGLFSDGESVTLSSLKGSFHDDVKKVQSNLYQQVRDQGYFVRNPSHVRIGYIVTGAVLAFIFFFGLALGIVGPFLAAIGVAVIGPFMPKRTDKGAEALWHAKGFKLFLEKAEKYRLQWQEKEHIFEQYLPYAMAFGVAEKWSKTFEGIQQTPPGWYHGAPGSHFNSLLLWSSLNNFSSSTIKSFSPPAASGSSGFGGGGFSGGGFGGGGGGSW